MGAISNVEALMDDDQMGKNDLIFPNGGLPTPTKRLWLLVVIIAFYPNGKLAYVNVSVGGIIILLIALLAGASPWSQIGPVLKALMHHWIAR